MKIEINALQSGRLLFSVKIEDGGKSEVLIMEKEEDLFKKIKLVIAQFIADNKKKLAPPQGPRFDPPHGPSADYDDPRR